jgi:hypothetical protein
MRRLPRRFGNGPFPAGTSWQGGALEITSDRFRSLSATFIHPWLSIESSFVYSRTRVRPGGARPSTRSLRTPLPGSSRECFRATSGIANTNAGRRSSISGPRGFAARLSGGFDDGEFTGSDQSSKLRRRASIPLPHGRVRTNSTGTTFTVVHVSPNPPCGSVWRCPVLVPLSARNSLRVNHPFRRFPDRRMPATSGETGFRGSPPAADTFSPWRRLFPFRLNDYAGYPRGRVRSQRCRSLSESLAAAAALFRSCLTGSRSEMQLPSA